MASDFDIVIIGAGVIGAAIALEASMSGAKVLLLDKSDFASSTSAAPFKIIHGGLRYIQHLDFSRLKESFEEQRFMRKAAPHLIKPLPFLVPCYGYGIKSTLALKTACTLYEFLSKSRNDGVQKELQLSDHKTLSRDEVLKIAPHISSKGLRGGVVFYDAQMLSPDRLSLAFVLEAEKQGAVVKNYSEVVRISASENDSGSNSISEIEIKDVITGAHYTTKPKVVINAMGPAANRIKNLFVDEQIKTDQSIEEPYLSKGIQVVLPQIISEYALSVESKGKDTASRITRGGRAYFLQPWRGHTLVGTTDTIYKGDPSKFKINLREIREFLSEVYNAYPSEMIKPMHVLHAFGGLRPIDPAIEKELALGKNRDGMNNTSRHEDFVDHSKQKAYGLKKVNNLISIAGIKYTTCRAVAEKTIKLLNQKTYNGKTFKIESGLSRKVCFLDNSEIPNARSLFDMVSVSDVPLQMNDVERMIQLYGSQASFVLKQSIMRAKSMRLEPSKALLFYQVEHAIKFEYARTLSDVVSRRLDLTGLGFPGHGVVEEISKYMQVFLGWDENYRSSELQKILANFTFEAE